MEEKGRRRHKKDRRQTLLAEIDPLPTSSVGRCSGEYTSMSMDQAMEATASFSPHAASAASAASTSRSRARPSRGIFVTATGRRSLQPPFFFLSMPSIWLPRHRWFSRVETGNQQTTASCMWVHTGLAPTRARDQDDGSIWVGYGLVPGFAEPVNRAI
jgi:hypothetical protein